jgi:hypothetical protein
VCLGTRSAHAVILVERSAVVHAPSADAE